MTFIGRASLGLAALLAPFAADAATFDTLSGERPLVWAHRGASYFARENTLEAFRLAGDLRADGFELDVFLTKDGALAVFHDNTLERLTDVESRTEFAGRARADGRWYVADFTLAELQTLEIDGVRNPPDPAFGAPGRDVIRDATRNPHAVGDDYVYRIPSYQEALDVLGEQPGLKVLTEVKDNFSQFGDRTPEAARAETIALLNEAHAARGYVSADSPVVVQSFSAPFMAEFATRLDEIGSTVRTVQLDGVFFLPSTIATQSDLAAFYSASFGMLDGLAVNFNLLPVDGASFFPAINPNGLDVIGAAHAAGLELYVWTLILPPGIDEESYYAWAFDPSSPIDFRNQYAQVIGLGADGLITDNPDIARAVLDGYGHATPIPLPAAGWLLLGGLAALGALRRRR